MMLDAVSSVAATSGKVQDVAEATKATEGGSFSDVLGSLAGGVSEALKFGEATAIAGLTGAAPPLAVVNAVIGAQHTLQAALAIRDKAVAAYQEVSRMAI